MSIRFAAIGLNHGHIYGQVNCLLEAGMELAWVYAQEPDLLKDFLEKYPGTKVARSEDEILNDDSIQVVTSASIPVDRAPLGIRVMQHAKDYLVDKPGFTTLGQLALAVSAHRSLHMRSRIDARFFDSHRQIREVV